MKIKLLGFLILSSLFFAPALFAADLHWEKDLQSAFDKAAKTKRPLMVMVESKNCRWCTKMKHRTLENKTVASRLKSYVLVKVDRDVVRSKYVPYAKYVPTIYFMTSQKEILESVTGYFGVLDFNSWIDDADAKLKKVKK